MHSLKKQFDRIDVDILNIALHTAGKEWQYQKVISPYSRIYLVTKGKAQIYIYGQKYLLTPGHMYLIPSFTLVDMFCGDSFTHYYIHFTSRIQIGLDILSLIKSNVQVNIEPYKFIPHLFNRLLALNPERGLIEHDANKPLYKAVTERASHLDAKMPISDVLENNGIFRQILALFFKQGNQGALPDTINGLGRFGEVIEYIRLHLHEPIVLSDMAEVADLNPTYFSNLFSKQMGVSPITYLNNQRIEKGQMLLLSSHDSLEQIAEQIGFDDKFYFSRCFKKITGLSPSAYRKQHFDGDGIFY